MSQWKMSANGNQTDTPIINRITGEAWCQRVYLPRKELPRQKGGREGLSKALGELNKEDKSGQKEGN